MDKTGISSGILLKCDLCGSWVNVDEDENERYKKVGVYVCNCCKAKEVENMQTDEMAKDMVNHPSHYAGGIDVIDPKGFTEYCCKNILKYIRHWRKKDGVQDLKRAKVYLEWMIESAEKEGKGSELN